MNEVRHILSEVFQSPMQNMSFPAYFKYVNEAGKLSARSMVDLLAVVFTILEEQEKANKQYDQNFKDIEEILAKLVDKKAPRPEEFVTKPLLKESVSQPQDIKAPADESPLEAPTSAVELLKFTCDICQKELSTKLALAGHKRSHK